LVRTGGQYRTHAELLQLEVVPRSARKRYTVRPLESTSTSPSRVIPTLMVVPVATGVGPGVGDGTGATVGVGLGEAVGAALGAAVGAFEYVPAVEVVPHAAAISAAATRAPKKTCLGCIR
jgi:hypothetical protein